MLYSSILSQVLLGRAPGKLCFSLSKSTPKTVQFGSVQAYPFISDVLLLYYTMDINCSLYPEAGDCYFGLMCSFMEDSLKKYHISFP